MPRDFTLVQSKKNDVFKVIEASGLDPRDFEWQVVKSRYMRLSPPVSKLVHTPTGYFFVFDLSEDYYGRDSFISIMSPGPDRREDISTAGVWSAQIRQVGIWLQLLVNEVEQPDLWTEIRRVASTALLALPSGIPDTRFTPEERPRIQAQLDELKSEISRLADLSEQQNQILDARVAEIAEATNELKRRQWYHFALGEFVQFMFEATLRGDIGRVFALAVRIFHAIVNPQPMITPPSV